jgi:plastocyanin
VMGRMDRTRLRTATVSLVAVAMAVAACGGSSSPKTTAGAVTPTVSTPASPARITIQGFAFGAPLTVRPGAEITVVNRDGAGHTVTADDGKSFNVTVAGGGGSATFTAPSAPGTYKFHCTVHPSMQGSLVVSG